MAFLLGIKKSQTKIGDLLCELGIFVVFLLTPGDGLVVWVSFGKQMRMLIFFLASFIMLLLNKSAMFLLGGLVAFTASLRGKKFKNVELISYLKTRSSLPWLRGLQNLNLSLIASEIPSLIMASVTLAALGMTLLGVTSKIASHVDFDTSDHLHILIKSNPNIDGQSWHKNPFENMWFTDLPRKDAVALASTSSHPNVVGLHHPRSFKSISPRSMSFNNYKEPFQQLRVNQPQIQ
ncbi:LOW QUALITY PROTEIN: hypothetical protein Cgig2_003205 [Carnegiea gigantea]|uniref:Uncharacterized protein n=1 Tax=Carnegiea gigantea TaxID=171969 RepID=A0A9Q1K4J0_9CARY|nr:LOW QUALITY PROTEIN: hypothetical protein Cgig2_003205 [Carnegiea gigantea]